MNRLVCKIQEKKTIINTVCIVSIFFFAILSFIPLMSPIASNVNLLNESSVLSTVYKLIVFACFALIVIITLIANKIEIDKKLIWLLCIYFCLSIFPNLFLNEKILIPSDGAEIYEPSLFTLIDSSIYCVRTIVMVIFYIELLPVIATKKLIINILNAFLVFGLLSVLYLFAIQYGNVLSFFKSSESINSTALSFFTNKNSFGIILSGMIAICLILITYSEKKTIYWILVAIFYLSSLLVLARTSIIASTILLILYIFSNFFVTRKYKIPFIIVASLIILIVIYITILYNSESFRSLEVNKKTYSIIEQFLSDSETATGRSYIWEISFEKLLDPIRLIFGYGDKISNSTLNSYLSQDKSYFGITSSFHNGLVNSIVSGGLLRFSIFLFICYYVFFKKHSFSQVKYTFILISILTSFIIIQFFEEVIIFETYLNSNLWTLIICSPLIFECIKLRDHEPVTNKDITICVTTVNKTLDEIIELISKNCLCGNIIVGCQGSSEEKCEKYKTNNLNAEIYFQTSLGVSKNRNYILSKAKTKYLIFLDDDIKLLDHAFDMMCGELNTVCDADLLFFNLSYKDKRKRKLKKRQYFKWIDARSFGINSIVFKNEFIKENHIKFNENIGPGCEISSGEDGQFAMAVAKKSNCCYKCEKTIIEISYENGSSWFRGYEKSYFINIGYTYSMCYGVLARVFAIYTLIKHRKIYLKDITFKQAYKYVIEGVKKHKNDK